jgi:DNA primase
LVDAAEIIEELDLEFFFERESLAYKLGRGVSGMQIHAKQCPACGDGRWRVYLNAETGIGNCFVCNKTYNKLTFIKEHYGFGDNEWAQVFSTARDVLKEQGWRPKRMVTAAVDPGPVVLPYSEPLPTPEGSNLVYLAQRGITGEIAKYFHLRWCEFGWWQFRDEDGKQKQQSFDSRVIIPVFDLDGTLATFQGRDLTGKSERKYLFPKMLPGTGRYLLNGQNVQLTEDAVLGEGAFDVMATKIALDQDVNLRHVVPIGSFGKHLSYGSTTGDDQLGRLVKLRQGGLRRLTIMWDGEPKALVAALDAAKLVTGIGLQARIALLPAGKDPNEVLPEVVRAAYYEAQVWTPSLDVRLRLRNPYGR